MARKSRKKTTAINTELKFSEFQDTMFKEPTAAYGRLSVEEEANGHSMENQITLLQNYIKEQDDLECVATYFDNGYTGTNFKRPAFNQMMNDIRQKKIRCIVVKDLSRFGRNMLEASYYIEKIFPFLGVRLIAVTDRFDSNNTRDVENMSVPLYNLINELYAKDISRKIWSSLQKKKEDGFVAGAAAPYGYIRNPETKHNEIDTETAFYVQLIFMWAYFKVSYREIAKRLQILGAPTPRERLYQMGIIKKEKEWKWQGTSVRCILENQTYTGDTVSNKTSQALFAGRKKTYLPEEEWSITPNTHPAIIPRDDFEVVQNILQENKEKFRRCREAAKTINEKFKDKLKNMVYCAECGEKMRFERLPHGADEDKKLCYYVCKKHNVNCICMGHKITTGLLQMLVMDRINEHLLLLCESEELVDQTQNDVNIRGSLAEIKNRFLKFNLKSDELINRKRKLYENYATGDLDLDEYLKMRDIIAGEYERCQKELKIVKQEKEDVEDRIKCFKQILQRFRPYLGKMAFDGDVVKELVQKIEVGNDKKIHLIFKFSIADLLKDFDKEVNDIC